MITLKQVAHEAQVSYLTALRAMGSSPGAVRAATADRVRAAADRLGYRPHAAARALTSRTSPYIGVVYGIGPGCNCRIPVAQMMRAYSEFHFELTDHLESHDYHVLISGANPHVAESGDDDPGIPKLLNQQHVGGLVVVGDIWPALHREIIRFHIPTVGIYCQSVSHVPTVDMNYQIAAKWCTRHLLDLGHRDIAFIPGRWKTWKTEPMQLGYLAAMAQAGVQPIACWERLQDSTTLVVDLLDVKRTPTAIVVYDDYEAVRVVDRLEAEGLRVPADVSVAAVQNMGPGSMRRPRISGCPIPSVPMAQAAADLLLRQLSGKRRGVRDELIEASFVAADSTNTPGGS